jgi:hypothetical protein
MILEKEIDGTQVQDRVVLGVGVVTSLERNKRVAGQFAVKHETETNCWTHRQPKQARLRDGQVLEFVCCWKATLSFIYTRVL